MPQLADFITAQNSGYETGKQQATGNALGMFIRTMLAQKQKNLDLQQEYGMKEQLLKTGEKIKSESPQGIAELAKTQAEGGLKSQELKLKEEAKTKYDAGDRSPEILKALDMFPTLNVWSMPWDTQNSSSSFPKSNTSTNPLPNKQTTKTPPIPASLKYDRNKEQVQYNKNTGEWRVVPK